jgi:hypothetical protein
MHFSQESIGLDLFRYGTRLMHIRVPDIYNISLVIAFLDLREYIMVMERSKIGSKALLVLIPPTLELDNLAKSCVESTSGVNHSQQPAASCGKPARHPDSLQFSQDIGKPRRACEGTMPLHQNS